ITVLPNTVNAFFNSSDTSGCVPLAVNFTQFSTGATFSSWDFGDGNVSTAPNPSHTFTQAGTYLVQLFINDGCSFDTATISITVHPQPQIDFTTTPDSVCASQPFQFNNLSS
ncbi:MAG TPA: PKD domain-containing protein, partial [Flavobacteriales bacterium]|nr:PKD domain-containing protein [Flavobacteriales bacterium]